MNPKTKLIVGLACCASLAIGIAQTPKATNELAVLDFENAPTNRNILELKVNGTLTWYLTNAPTITMAISTNNSVNWVTIETLHDDRNDNRLTQLAIPIYDQFKQVGTVQTNRILTVVHDGATNLVLLKVLGKEEWPSQTRVVQGRRQ